MTGIRIAGIKQAQIINTDEVNRIKGAKSKKEVRSVWGRIKDWFCGTHKEKAKQALFDLYDAQDNKVRVEAFSTLRHLAAPGFKDAFVISTDPDKNTLTLKIADEVEVELSNADNDPYHLLQEITAKYGNDSTEERVSALKRDINRSEYTLSTTDGIIYYKAGDGISDEEKKASVDTIKGTDYQRKMVGILATQSLILAMQGVRSEFISFGEAGINDDSRKQHFTVTMLPSDVIKVDIQYEKENALDMIAELPEEMKVHRKITLKSSFLVEKDQTHLLYASWNGSH